METPIRVLVVDDHVAVREGITAIVNAQEDMVLVGEAVNGKDAIAAYANLRPDVTLMDLQMPVMGGIEAITQIRAEARHARIIVLTVYDGDVQAVRALEAGASAYLLKSSLRTELLETIRAVHSGNMHIPPTIAQQIAYHLAVEALSEREIAILKLVANGNSNKVIGWKLSITEETVKSHMKSILSKLDVNDRTHAVTVALRRGIFEL